MTAELEADSDDSDSSLGAPPTRTVLAACTMGVLQLAGSSAGFLRPLEATIA
jgi:hypothetical protein